MSIKSICFSLVCAIITYCVFIAFEESLYTQELEGVVATNKSNLHESLSLDTSEKTSVEIINIKNEGKQDYITIHKVSDLKVYIPESVAFVSVAIIPEPLLDFVEEIKSYSGDSIPLDLLPSTEALCYNAKLLAYSAGSITNVEIADALQVFECVPDDLQVNFVRWRYLRTIG